jgi:hypothetical protein
MTESPRWTGRPPPLRTGPLAPPASARREGGHDGLLEFLEPKYFAFD